ncbi:MAG TPA: ATP-binding protein [Caldimonas sp.]|jgi:PAS domain S-box-containing protein|nr:ATP-binding protein [Caldimonas sp.]HEX2540832.1 ATP-binding protein [Caldimonas sp.]
MLPAATTPPSTLPASLPHASGPLPHWLQWGLPLALTTLACAAATALVGLVVALPAGQASPLHAGAGVALACVLVYGRRMLPGVGLGSLLASFALGTLHGAADGAALASAMATALGAVLQAAAGAALVQRLVRQPLTLTLPAEVAMFVVACTVSSLVAPSVATAAMVGLGAVAPDAVAVLWTTCWIGELAGLLIGTPIVLTLIGWPRSQWAPRRLPVGLTMTLVLVFLVLGIVQASRWRDERLRTSFGHEAASASLILAAQLREPLRALEALHGVFSVSQAPSRTDLKLATQGWLKDQGVRTMGWGERVRRDDGPPFGIAGSRASGADSVVLRYLEPGPDGDLAPGTTALSVPAARAAVAEAIDSGRPAATAGFPLLRQPGGAPARMGVAVYQALYDGEATNALERRAALRGVAFVTLGLDAQLDGLAGKVPPYLRVCILDARSELPLRRLAGPAGCDAGKPDLTHDHPLVFAGRPWTLRVSSRAEDIPGVTDPGAWWFSVVGLISAAMLGASLLITTGRTRRIENAVLERTAALRAEVGERHRAEAALRASEQRFRNILDNVPIGVVYTDVAGRLIQVNPRFTELTGYSETELAALSPLALAHPDDIPGDEAMTAQLVAGQIPGYRRHKRILTRSGDTVWVRARVSLLRNAQNEPWRIVGVVEDITEHLRLEEAEHAREAAEAANRAKSEFLSRMSHELRTPLNAMLGFAQLLEIDRAHPLAPAQRPWVGQIQEAGWHLLDMINDVLDLSRIESDNLRLQSVTLDLPELVRATTALVASDAARRDIRISEELAAGAAAVLGDPTRVKQILTNLLSNAVKYNVEGGRIHVQSRVSSADSVEISVTDTGLGMTAEQMQGLFQPFNRLGRERSALQGTGIGLVISRRLAELMGGSIRVKSVPGKGSSFILKLGRALDPDTVPSALDGLEPAPAAYHRRIVHYIEDNETNVEVMRGILALRSQVQLEASVTGLDGLAAIRLRLPHLILLDMHLPDISGLELLRHLRADPATIAIPTIVVSADATSQQIEEALRGGAVRYLTKPVDVTELLAVVDDLLRPMDTGFN